MPRLKFIILAFSLFLFMRSVKSLNSSLAIRKSKQFSLISIINFPNDHCVNDDGTAGECYTGSECIGRGGTSSSTCGNGIGVCCYITKTSGGSDTNVVLNNTYIRNPGYTGTYSEAGTYSHTIKKINSNICQFRLDFETMELVNPVSGACSTDMLTIKEGLDRTSTYHIPPQFCGTGTGQHMYLQAHPNENVDATIDIVLGTSTEGRKWNIRVTQIECGKIWAAPPNCLQYHTGVSGTFNSWNYDGSTGQYTNDAQYSICMRREKGYCGNTINKDGSMKIGNGADGRSGDTCVPDHVAVPQGSTTGNGWSLQRWCGTIWGAASTSNSASDLQVTTYQTPFRVFVRNNAADNGNIGFKMIYNQIPC